MTKKITEANNRPSLEYYLKAQYTIILEPGVDDWYGAIIRELPGCIAQGKTPEEALKNIEEARQVWITTGYKKNKGIPLPRTEEESSRSFLVRMPPSLHRELKQNAKREGVSLNQYINILLGRNVGIDQLQSLGESFIRKFNHRESDINEKLKFFNTRFGFIEDSLSKILEISINPEEIMVGTGLYLDSMILEMAEDFGNFLEVGLKIKPEYLAWEKILSEDIFNDLFSGRLSMIIANKEVCDQKNEENKRHDRDENTYQYHDDLFFYNAFAIMVHPDFLSNNKQTFLERKKKATPTERNSYIIEGIIQQLEGCKIIAAGNTDHAQSVRACFQKYTNFTEGKDYFLEEGFDPNEGLNKFLEHKADAYVGGIPQRIIALQHNAEELIAQDHVDLGVMQVNGLITKRDSIIDEKTIANFWYAWSKTIKSIDNSLEKGNFEYLASLIKKYNDNVEKYNNNPNRRFSEVKKLDENFALELLKKYYWQQWELFPKTRQHARQLMDRYNESKAFLNQKDKDNPDNLVDFTLRQNGINHSA